MPKTSRSEQMDYKGLEIIADEFTGTFNGEITGSVDAANVTGLTEAARTALSTKPQIVALTSLTGTVGTANDAMTAVAAATAASTDTSAASLASVNTAITAINNNLADLQAKVNSIITASKA